MGDICRLLDDLWIPLPCNLTAPQPCGYALLVMKDQVRVAIVGAGNIGMAHIESLRSVERATIAAVCDAVPERAQIAADLAAAPAYTDYQALLQEVRPDALVVSTPHFHHVPISVAAAAQGVHLLVEKPLAVHAADAQRICAAVAKARLKKPGLVFAAMLNQRTYGHWRKIKDLIETRELGRLVRATWIITDWFRTQHYYATGGWRATWAGEGGGVLLNQCPHNLDLYQWFFGMPSLVTAFAGFGKYHDIEVEDEVTAYFEHPEGMIGHFVTSTGESPGTNRLEIVGEHGRLVFEDNALTLMRNRRSMLKVIRESNLSFAKVESWPTEIPYADHGEPGHRLVLRSFISAILDGGPLYATGEDAVNSVVLGNAILSSALQSQGNAVRDHAQQDWTGQSQLVSRVSVPIPFDTDAFRRLLQTLAAESRYRPDQDQQTGAVEDLSQSY